MTGEALTNENAALLPPEVQEWIKKNIPPKILTAHSTTDEDVLRQLATDADAEVRKALIKNINLPDDVLRTLAHDEDVNVRGIVVAYTNKIPDDVLLKLAQDPDAGVRSCLAEKRDHVLPDAAYLLLAEDDDSFVLEMLAFRPNIPLAAVERLLLRGNLEAKIHLMVNVQSPVPLDAIISFAEKIDDHHKLGDNEKILAMEAVRRLARHPDTPLEWFKKIAGGGDDRTLLLLARNSSVPLWLVKEAARSNSVGVWTEAAVVKRLTEDDPEYAGYPEEWVHAQLFGGTK